MGDVMPKEEIWTIMDKPEIPKKQKKGQGKLSDNARILKHEQAMIKYRKLDAEYAAERNIERISSIIFRPLTMISALFDISVAATKNEYNKGTGATITGRRIGAGIMVGILAGPMVAARISTNALNFLTGTHSEGQKERSRELAQSIGEKIYGVTIKDENILRAGADNLSIGNDFHPVRSGLKFMINNVVARSIIGLFSNSGKALGIIGENIMKSVNGLSIGNKLGKSIQKARKENPKLTADSLKNTGANDDGWGPNGRTGGSKTASTASNTSGSSNSSDKEPTSPKM